MSFWRWHMPRGMLLRSGSEWHLDPYDEHTIERFLAEHDPAHRHTEPLSLDTYLSYAEWFRNSKHIEPLPHRVERLDKADGVLCASLEDGSAIAADRILLALGFRPFAYSPRDLVEMIPAKHRSHTSACNDPGVYKGRRVLIVGGRQSAMETGALIAEAGATSVCICHRHATPRFTTSDWSWVAPLLTRISNDPAWYRSLSEVERERLNRRFWEEGRLKLEPWLRPRVRHPAITLMPDTRLVGAREGTDGLTVDLDDGTQITVDDTLLATGYRVDLGRIEMLATGNLIDQITTEEGFPVLDDLMQSSVPGLHFTSLPATRDFGLFFAFTAAARASARIVAKALGP